MDQINDHKKVILVVDDDETLRKVIKEVLENFGLTVREAENGLVAKTISQLNHFDIVLSDVRMPVMDGTSLLKYFAQTYSDTKFILMTGFSEIIEAQQAYDLGATEFLTKPFKKEELLEAINNCLGPVNKTDKIVSFEIPDIDNNYCKISIGDFNTGKNLVCDIYLRLSATKYIKIAHEGFEVPHDRLKLYKSKGVFHLHVKKTDFSKYVGYNINSTANNSIANKTEKLRLQKHTTELLLEQVFVDGIDKNRFEESSNMMLNTVKMINDDLDYNCLVEALNRHSDYLYAHSLGVGIYATMLAKEMNWTSPATIFKLSVGGLLHDIGKKEIPRAIIEKPRNQLTSDELVLLESHTTRGRDILSQIQKIPEDILKIALQHHENIAGTGYPFRVKKETIHPLAKVIGLSNLFCHLILQGPNSPLLKPADAAARIWEYNRAEFDGILLKALMLMVGASVPEELKKINMAA